jgi:tetratricopeptide (TPR) repeat protein
VKLQYPTSNIQKDIRFQAPNNRACALDGFGGWCLELFWSLVIGAWSFRLRVRQAVCVLFVVSPLLASAAQVSDASFIAGTQTFKDADFERSAAAFRQSAALQPASGTLQNLGLAEWQQGKVGAAILAWEQALWLDPFNQSARVNLRFARKAAQLEAPDLSWNEVVSAWLPINWWAWLAGMSLWLAVGMGTLPGVLRQPKAAWHQALAAFGVMVFLLSVPAHLGVHSRSHLGFVLNKETPLRMTPTLEAQAITRLSAGEPVRSLRTRGNYVLVRTSRSTGWLARDKFSLICPPDGKI